MLLMLLLNSIITLEYSVGKGFLGNFIEKTRFLLGGVIGHQIMERRTITFPTKAVPRLSPGQIYLPPKVSTYSAVPLIAKGEVKCAGGL
jgi:hypothetical protein